MSSVDDLETQVTLAWQEAPSRIGERVTWRNVYRFTEAPEIAHDGHGGVITAVGDRDITDGESFPMFVVACDCGATFQTFTEEVES